MPDFSLFWTQLPGLFAGVMLTIAATLAKDHYLQRKSHARANLGKWHGRRIEKLECISRTAWKLRQNAKGLVSDSSQGSIAGIEAKVEHIRDMPIPLAQAAGSG